MGALRGTQIGRRVFTKEDTPNLRVSTIARRTYYAFTCSTTGAPVDRARGIYVPTRGVGGAEGGGTGARFDDLSGRIIHVAKLKRAIYVPIDAEGPLHSHRTGIVPALSRVIYVPISAEGPLMNLLARTAVCPAGAEGYSHR